MVSCRARNGASNNIKKQKKNEIRYIYVYIKSIYYEELDQSVYLRRKWLVPYHSIRNLYWDFLTKTFGRSMLKAMKERNS